MTALNQIDGHEIESKKVHKIEDNKNGEFPTPDLLTDGKIDPKKAEVKATQTIEEAAKEKNSAEREKKPNIF
ncbi:MAG: hypothetical protein LBO09_09325 [Candidatus Peribacteria bacterium]|jgi:hypothetical protein|nr:hypothetical protein [Candidatus Peribacteria bacterium]